MHMIIRRESDCAKVFGGICVSALASLFAPIGAMAAQSQVREACRTNRTGNACIRARTEQVRAAYDLPPLEAHRIAADRVRQVFHASGDLPMVSFVARRGRSAVVTVHYPRRRDGRAPPPLRAAVPARAWREVLALSEPFDARPSSREAGTICLDGATYLVEAVEPGQSARMPATMRQKLGHDCEPGPVPAYVDGVARIALSLLPPCARIDARHYYGPLRRLAACRLLAGDRMAAADVLNRARGFSMISNEGDTARLAGLFSARSELHWDGARQAGDPAAVWAARAAPSLGVTRLSIEAVEGMSAGRMRLTGHLTRPVDTSSGTTTGPETAQVEQLWQRDRDGFFRIMRATVGPWEPFAPPRS
jgi:hypothetical protein